MELWLLLGIVVMLFGFAVWLDLRLQKVEDVIWDHLISHLEDDIAADDDA